MSKVLALSAALAIALACFAQPAAAAQKKKGANKNPTMSAQEKCFREARKMKGTRNKDRAAAACG